MIHPRSPDRKENEATNNEVTTINNVPKLFLAYSMFEIANTSINMHNRCPIPAQRRLSWWIGDNWTKAATVNIHAAN